MIIYSVIILYAILSLPHRPRIQGAVYSWDGPLQETPDARGGQEAADGRSVVRAAIDGQDAAQKMMPCFLFAFNGRQPSFPPFL